MAHTLAYLDFKFFKRISVSYCVCLCILVAEKHFENQGTCLWSHILQFGSDISVGRYLGISSYQRYFLDTVVVS